MEADYFELYSAAFKTNGRQFELIGNYTSVSGWEIMDSVFPNAKYGFNGRHFVVCTILSVSYRVLKMYTKC